MVNAISTKQMRTPLNWNFTIPAVGPAGSLVMAVLMVYETVSPIIEKLDSSFSALKRILGFKNTKGKSTMDSTDATDTKNDGKVIKFSGPGLTAAGLEIGKGRGTVSGAASGTFTGSSAIAEVIKGNNSAPGKFCAIATVLGADGKFWDIWLDDSGNVIAKKEAKDLTEGIKKIFND